MVHPLGAQTITWEGPRMATVEPRPKDNPKAWRVSWRLDGKRGAPVQSITIVTSREEADRAALLAKAHSHALTREQMLAMLNPQVKRAGETVAELCTRYVASLHVEGSTRKEYER